MKSIPPRGYHILIENGRRVLVSDCTAIAEYTPERIQIRLRSMNVIITGSELTLADFFGDEIQIHGFIRNIALSTEDTKADASFL